MAIHEQMMAGEGPTDLSVDFFFCHCHFEMAHLKTAETDFLSQFSYERGVSKTTVN